MKPLQTKQDALAQLLLGGAFRFDPEIATVPYEEYQQIIESLEPVEEYSIGYDLGGINWLENCFLDRNDRGIVEVIRRERTWQYGTMRAFQLVITRVPSIIVIETEPEEPAILDTTWYCDATGTCRAYIQLYNDNIVENIRD